MSLGQAGGSANRQRPGELRDVATASSRDLYRYWLDAVTEPRHYSGGHLSALAAYELLFEARGRYFAEAVPLAAIASSLWLVYRHLVLDYVDEAFVGERLRCGVAAVSRGRRSIRMRQTLEVVGEYGRPVAHARLVVVAFDVVHRNAIEVPPEVWDTIVAFDGGSRGYEHAVRLAGKMRPVPFSRPSGAKGEARPGPARSCWRLELIAPGDGSRQSPGHKAKVQQRAAHTPPGGTADRPRSEVPTAAGERDHNYLARLCSALHFLSISC